jgi:uncharacterized protein YndB with AHSA1/START domain
MSGMQHVEVTRTFAQPVEHVFRRYTDHACWGEWTGLGPVWLAAAGEGDRDGVGCVRAFSWVPGLREQVTRFDAPHRMEYRVTAGPVPLADHHGVVEFEACGAGTRVTWRVRFRSRLPLTGRLMQRGLTVLFARILKKLAADLEGRGA